MNQEINNGLIIPDIKNDHFILGGFNSLPPTILRPDGDWTPYLPSFEAQFNSKYDVYNCTAFGTTNALETLLRAVGDEKNYSDRFLGVVAGTRPPGNDPHAVAQAVRHYGCIDESLLPFSDELGDVFEYYSYKNGNESECRKQGALWIGNYEYGHEWVVTPDTDPKERVRLMKQALLYSPLCVSVDAWWQNEQGLFYSPQNSVNGHWCMVYKIDETGIYVFDSYFGNNPSGPTHYLKKLTLDHNIMMAKRYSIKKVTPKPQTYWFMDIIRSLWEVVFQLEKTKQMVEEKEKSEVTPAKPAEPKVEPQLSRINEFCQLIQTHEGWYEGSRSWRNNNPGNCKFSTKGYAKKYGIVSSDMQGFAVFKTKEIGYSYLRNLTQQKMDANPHWNFYQFFEWYAPSTENNSKHYADVVAMGMKTLATNSVKGIVG